MVALCLKQGCASAQALYGTGEAVNWNLTPKVESYSTTRGRSMGTFVPAPGAIKRVPPKSTTKKVVFPQFSDVTLIFSPTISHVALPALPLAFFMSTLPSAFKVSSTTTNSDLVSLYVSFFPTRPLSDSACRQT